MASPLARRLRKTPTEAEIRLWSRLRRKQIFGFRYRRQHPMGPYVVGFFCSDAGLVIEVDGSQHATGSADAIRTRWLEERGYRVLRFWNNDVLANTEGVLQTIVGALTATPPTRPLKGAGSIAAALWLRRNLLYLRRLALHASVAPRPR